MATIAPGTRLTRTAAGLPPVSFFVVSAIFHYLGPSLAVLLEPIFGGLSHGAAVGLSVAIAFALVTAIHISIGEQVPKMLAIAHAERTARRVARPLNWFRIAARVSGRTVPRLLSTSGAVGGGKSIERRPKRT